MDEITKEVAIIAMQDGGYKIAHKNFINGDYIIRINDDYCRDNDGNILEMIDFYELYKDCDYDDGWIIVE